MTEDFFQGMQHVLAQGLNWLMVSHPEFLTVALTGCALWLLTRR